MTPFIPYEPIIKVGLCENSAFGLSPCGEYHIEAGDNTLTYTPLSSDACMLVKGIQIGRQFHWQQYQNLRYPGVIVLTRNDNNSLLLNFVKAETYLQSVVGSEMNPEAPVEFIKAHSIISRSWLFRQIHYKSAASSCSSSDSESSEYIFWTEADAHEEFDVCPDDHCQRYQGLDAITEASAEAVRQTRGMVLLDNNDDIIDARFSKCCGGKTEIFSSCWDNKDFPYLISVDDPYCHPDRLSRHDASKLLKDFDLFSDYYVWDKEVDATLIRERIKEILNFDPGEITGLTPVKTGPSGRIIKLKIIGKCGDITIGKELLIRRILSTSHLYSSAFTIESRPESFILKGRGWGHGVGLCQIGAAVMAAEGFSAEEILRYYYPDTHIKKLYE